MATGAYARVGGDYFLGAVWRFVPYPKGRGFSLFGICMDKVLAWFKGRRVFPRWKLLAMVFSGMLIGWMVSLGEYSIVILLLLGLYEISKRESDKT